MNTDYLDPINSLNMPEMADMTLQWTSFFVPRRVCEICPSP